MLIRKMRRDIVKNRVQFLAIFLMMFFGCFLYSGITGEWNGLWNHFDTFRSEQNLADEWAYRETFSEEELSKVKADPQIRQAEGRLCLPATVQGKDDASLTCYAAKSNEISRLYVTEGAEFDGKEEGIWLDALFAGENGYQTGDQITLNIQGMKLSGTIRGLAYSPEYIYGVSGDEMVPNHKRSGFAWISTKILPGEMPLFFNQIAIKLREDSGSDVLKNILGDEVQTIKAADHPTVSVIKDEIEQHKSMGNIFSAAFLLIALMITVTTMHRMLKNQRTQIGILKALGFTRSRLMRHYLSHSVAVCGLGALAGYVLGTQVLPGIIYRFLKTMYVLPVWEGILPGEAAVLPLLCVGVSLFISYCICRKYLRGSAAQCLSGESGLQTTGNLPGMRTWGRAARLQSQGQRDAGKRLTFGSLWNLRDILRNRLRSFMTLCGVLGCTALLFCAFALYDTFDNLSEWTFTKQQNYACKITGIPDKEGQEELKRLTNGEYLMEGFAVIWHGDKEKEVSLTVPESNRYWRLAEDLQTFTDIGDGAALSKKTAESLGIEEGDMISWKHVGEKSWCESRVEAIVRTTMSQGIVMKREAYEKTGQSYLPIAVVGDIPAEGFGDYEQTCTISSQKELTRGIEDMMEGMVMMITLLVTGAVLLGGIMLYNLGVLSYLERYREFATMKVLGFTDKKIRSIMVQQNVWLSAAGILLGIPAGYLLMCYMLTTIPESMDVPVMVRGVSWGISIAGTLGISWIISRIVSRKIPHIDMVEALKAKE